MPIFLGTGCNNRRFLTSGRPGIYFKVLLEGEVEAGDSIDLISKDENNITIKDIVPLYVKDTKDVESMQRAIRVKDLPIGQEKKSYVWLCFS